jgi:hypothetical protein
MRRFPVGPFVALLAVIAVIGGIRIFAKSEGQRYTEVQRVLSAPSRIDLDLSVSYPQGPIAQEDYHLVDADGDSIATYSVTDRKGDRAHFNEEIHGYGVSFAFEKLVQDGIWQITSKPARGRNEPIYTVFVKQTVQREHGSRKVSFSDPEYWARAREFHLTLDRSKATPDEADLIKLEASTNPDARYLKVVDDFRAFGSPAFKATIATARKKLLAS